MTEAERVRLAEAAERAMHDFLRPAFAAVEADYAEKLIATAASTDPRAAEIIQRLATGIRVCREARGQIEALVADGKLAREDMIHAKKIEQFSPAERRLLNIGQL